MISLLHYLPNALSLSRVGLALLFPFAPPGGWRVGVVLAAALSDLFDGLAARWLHAESNAGRLLDPLADKFFVLVLAGTLVAEGALHPLWVIGLAGRDITVLIGLGYLTLTRQWARGRRLRPSWVGKAATAGQFAVLLALAWGEGPVWALAAASALCAVAGVEYAVHFFREPGPTVRSG
ncbi:MAG: CDP-alcohol phosphatidyltransferase family protein [Gemmataceae bacterium]|nr:CDP-alcohol phosphatidyltransferase family protein [Gemmataceae bacterium]